MQRESESKILSLVGDARVERDADMSARCSLKAGGRAELLVSPEDESSLVALVSLLRSEGIPYFILGNGTNVLFRDGVYRGAVIKIPGADKQDTVLNGRVIKAGAGALLSGVAQVAADAGLSGMEALSGIPGSVGGAARMNAGAYGSEIAGIFKSAEIYDAAKGSTSIYSKEDMRFAYRSSVIDEDKIVLSAEFELTEAPSGTIRDKMHEYTNLRVSKQPLDMPSAGSFFKRPGDGIYAAALIDQAGLKGKRVGGAMVSDRHAGFIVNTGGARASDILALAELVVKTVYDKTGITLEPEPVIVGGEPDEQ